MVLPISNLTRICLTVVLLFIGDIGDHLESSQIAISSPVLLAVLDNAIHTFIGILTWSVITDDPWTISADLFGVALFSSVIDLDHFIAAKTVTLSGALKAPHRGIFHCSGFMVAVSLFLAIIGKSKWALILIVSVIPHHLRDATRRGLYLYPPYVHSPPLPKSIVRFLLPCFPWFVIAIMNFKFGEKSSKEIFNV